jgi:glycosyltransferase involved in cell wall biosynthesis
LAAVAADERFACVIGGEGPQAGLVRRYASESNRIIYLGHVPPDRVPLITAACDVVYYGFDETNPNARWSAPNKLYEAIAAGKPILTGDFGEVGDAVRSERCGVLTDTRTPEAIIRALEQIASQLKDGWGEHRGSATQSRWTRRNAVRHLVDAYIDLNGPRQTRD